MVADFAGGDITATRIFWSSWKGLWVAEVGGREADEQPPTREGAPHDQAIATSADARGGVTL